MAFDRVMEQYIGEHDPLKDMEKINKFFEKSLKSALYPMDNEEKRDFCNKISWKINGWDMTKAVQRAYEIYIGKIKNNSRGNERQFQIALKGSNFVFKRFYVVTAYKCLIKF